MINTDWKNKHPKLKRSTKPSQGGSCSSVRFGHFPSVSWGNVPGENPHSKPSHCPQLQLLETETLSLREHQWLLRDGTAQWSGRQAGRIWLLSLCCRLNAVSVKLLLLGDRRGLIFIPFSPAGLSGCLLLGVMFCWYLDLPGIISRCSSLQSW